MIHSWEGKAKKKYGKRKIGRDVEGGGLEPKYSHKSEWGKKVQESSAEEEFTRRTRLTRSDSHLETWKVDLREESSPAAGKEKDGG